MKDNYNLIKEHIGDDGNIYRLCWICGRWLLLTNNNFHKNKTARWGFNRICKECRNTRDRKYASVRTSEAIVKRRIAEKKYRTKHPEKTREREILKREKNKLNAIFVKKKNEMARKRKEYLMGLWDVEIKKRGMSFCYFCGFNECFAAIDFHHKNPQDKKEIISHLFDRTPTKERLDELEKCIPLCANHHRMLHAGVITLEQVMDNYEKMFCNRLF